MSKNPDAVLESYRLPYRVVDGGRGLEWQLFHIRSNDRARQWGAGAARPYYASRGDEEALLCEGQTPAESRGKLLSVALKHMAVVAHAFAPFLEAFSLLTLCPTAEGALGKFRVNAAPSHPKGGDPRPEDADGGQP